MSGTFLQLKWWIWVHSDVGTGGYKESIVGVNLMFTLETCIDGDATLGNGENRKWKRARAPNLLAFSPTWLTSVFWRSSPLMKAFLPFCLGCCCCDPQNLMVTLSQYFSTFYNYPSPTWAGGNQSSAPAQGRKRSTRLKSESPKSLHYKSNSQKGWSTGRGMPTESADCKYSLNIPHTVPQGLQNKLLRYVSFVKNWKLSEFMTVRRLHPHFIWF